MKTETDALKDLYVTLIDSREGYAEAADVVESDRLQTMFSDLSERRADEARQMRTFLENAGVEMDDDGSILATAHRTYLDLKDKMMDGDDAIIAELIRGEEELLKTYNDAIEPMTADSDAYKFANAHHDRLSERLDELRTEERQAA